MGASKFSWLQDTAEEGVVLKYAGLPPPTVKITTGSPLLIKPLAGGGYTAGDTHTVLFTLEVSPKGWPQALLNNKLDCTREHGFSMLNCTGTFAATTEDMIFSAAELSSRANKIFQ